jgi:outer membrane protein OmpA-like peptidoglycan-associated protein
MKAVYRLLMAGTVLSSVVSIQMATAGNLAGAPEQDNAKPASATMLAQVAAPDSEDKKKHEEKKQEDKKKQDAAPPKAPAAPTAAPLPTAPAKPPVAAPAPPSPPPAAAPAPSAPPPAAPRSPQAAPPDVPRPAAPPQVSPAPSEPPAARPVAPPPGAAPPHIGERPIPRAGERAPSPVQPSVPSQPPAAQTAPQAKSPAVQTAPSAAPPAAQMPPTAAPVRPATPPAAQQTAPAQIAPAPTAPAPAVPPAAQTAPASPAQPAAQGGAVTLAPAGVAPNTQSAPLQRSGVPAPTAQQAQPIAPAAVGAGISPQSAQGQPLRRMEELRVERRESTEGGRTIIREPDRTIIREGGQTVIRHSEIDRFRYGASDVRVERRGNDNVTVVVRPDGDRVVTVVDDNGFLIRRSRILTDGREIIIIDNRPRGSGFVVGGGFGGFVVNLPPPVVRIPRERYIVEDEQASRDVIYETLIAPPIERIERRYSLDEVRYTAPLRDRMPRIDLNTVTFDTGSWEVTSDQVQKLSAIADGLNRAIQQNPREVFLIEGHTDAVGTDVDNLSLSDRRAESVAVALTQQFKVPAENLSTQGYGEQYLKLPTDKAERVNRRVAVRRITPLLTGQNP